MTRIVAMFFAYFFAVYILTDVNSRNCQNVNPPLITNGNVAINKDSAINNKDTATYTCDTGFKLGSSNSTIQCISGGAGGNRWDNRSIPFCVVDENATTTVTHDQGSSESTIKPSPTVDESTTSTSESSSEPSATAITSSASFSDSTDSDFSTTAVPNTGLNNRVTGDKSITVVYVSVPLVVVICVLIGVLVLLWRSSQEKVRFVNETGTGAVVSITSNSYSNGDIISTDPAANGNIAGSEYAEIKLPVGPRDRAQEDQANEYQMIDEVVNEAKGRSAQPSSYSHVERKPVSNAGSEYSLFNNKIKENSVTTDYSKVQSRTVHVVVGPQKESLESSYDRIGMATASNKRDKCEKRPDLVEPASNYSQIQSGGATVPKQSAKEEVDEYSHLDYKQGTAKSDATGLISSQDINVQDESSSNLKENSSNRTAGGYETPVGVRHEYLKLQPTWQNADESSKSKTEPGSDVFPQQTCDGFQYQCAKDIGSVADTDRVLNESEMNSIQEETENNESHDYFVLEKTF